VGCVIIKCSYCGHFLSEKEFKIVDHKVRIPKRKPVAAHKYHAADSDIEELRTMKSGEKHLWLKYHVMEVLYYLDENGDAETRRHYGISSLDLLEEMGHWDWVLPLRKTITKTEMLEAKIRLCEQEIGELRKQIPSAIAKLSPEEQIKLLTFQLSQAVSKLHIKENRDELRIDQEMLDKFNNVSNVIQDKEVSAGPVGP
jgi:hypothetical protein